LSFLVLEPSMWRVVQRVKQHGHVLTGSVVAGSAAVAAFTPRALHAQDSPTSPSRSLYLHKAKSCPAIIGKASEMRKLFLQQNHAKGASTASLPRHVPVLENGPLTRDCGKRVTLRVAQWNINCLCGPDARSPQTARAVSSMVGAWDADVVLFQEVPVGPAEASWPEPWRSTFPTKSMRDLEKQLREHGYKVQLRTHCPNASMLCSKLAADHVFDSFSLDGLHAHRSSMLEDRAARLVTLRLSAQEDSRGDAPVIAVYATHLHHDNATLGLDGVRHAEAVALLRHWHDNAPPRTCCAVIASDFNQARRLDYSAQEWEVVSAGLASVRQPGDDGVASLLAASGWTCAYDVASAARNWPGGGAPPLTHWTGTTVDYPYVFAGFSGARVDVVGVYVVHTSVSDHLPIITDIAITL